MRLRARVSAGVLVATVAVAVLAASAEIAVSASASAAGRLRAACDPAAVLALRDVQAALATVRVASLDAQAAPSRLRASYEPPVALAAHVSAQLLAVVDVAQARADTAPARLRAVVEAPAPGYAHAVGAALASVDYVLLAAAVSLDALEHLFVFDESVASSDSAIVAWAFFHSDMQGETDAISLSLAKDFAESQPSAVVHALSLLKPFAEAQVVAEDTPALTILKSISESEPVLDTLSIRLGLDSAFVDDQMVADAIAVITGKPVSDTQAVTDTAALAVGKVAEESQGAADDVSFFFTRVIGAGGPTAPLHGSLLLNEMALHENEQADISWSTDHGPTLHTTKILVDIAGASDPIDHFDIAKAIADSQPSTDPVAKHVGKAPFEETVAAADAAQIVLQVFREFDECLTSALNGAALSSWPIHESDQGECVLVSDALQPFSILKPLQDTQAVADLAVVNVLQFRLLDDRPLNDAELN